MGDDLEMLERACALPDCGVVSELDASVEY